MHSKRRQYKKRNFCYKNFTKFLQETTLHGLRFIGDESISLWERGFFLCAFVAALITTANLISYIYSIWSLTPIIIVTNPFPTPISEIPFPSITLCNMNQLLLSRVANYSKNSYETAIIDMICFDDFERNERRNGDPVPQHDSNNNLKITEFINQHAQPCSDMLLSCNFNSLRYNCSDLFREYLTDGGLCCVFNLVDPKFLYKVTHRIKEIHTNSDKAAPVDWSPELGYQKNLPDEFYPRTAEGIGVLMGLSLILNAQVHEYYCSSTNGPGFKIDLHNPIEVSRIKDIGLAISPGQDTRFRVKAHSSSAVPRTRGFSPSVRNCIFNDESDLVYYKYYTRRNCENECQAYFLYNECKCIPYHLPLVFANASICGSLNSVCMNKAQKTWLRSTDNSCRRKCLKSCFGLAYTASSFSVPLIQGNYVIENAENLKNFSLEYIRDNIAIVNIYFHDLVFYGEVQNVYVGFIEFLSNIGGILSLFLGFSFISLIEVFYYGIINPFFRWIKPENQRNAAFRVPKEDFNTSIWYSHELYPTKKKHFQNGLINYRHQKLDKLKDQLKENSRMKTIKKLQSLQNKKKS